MKRLFYFPVLLIAYEFVLNLSNDMYTPAMPQISGHLLTSYNVVQLTITAWLFGEAAFALFLGPLSDRFGRRPVLLGGGVLFAISTLICSATQSVTLLIIARFLQGVSVGSFMIAGYASVHELYEGKQAIYFLAWMASVSVVAPMVGPLAGGLVLIIGSWRLIFGILFALGVIVLIPLWIIMPEANQEPDLKALQFKRFTQVYLKILSNRRFLFSSLSFSALYATLFIWISASPYLIIEVLHYRPDQYGWAQMPVFGGFLLGAQIVKPLLNRVKIPQLIHTGLLITFAGALFLLFRNMYGGKTLSALIVPMFFIAFGFGLASAPLNRTTLTSTTEKRGSAVAVFYLLMALGGSLGSFMISILHETFFSVIGVLLIFVSLACLFQFAAEKKEEGEGDAF